VERLDSVGPPVGLLPGIAYASQTVSIRGGDRLFFYTDGLTDRSNRDGSSFGEEGLIEAARRCQHASPANMTEMILEESERFADGVPPDDDVTLLVVKCYRE
jgi:sigma-B regulation protein RsbU (phosphoserine phosphatase)